MISYNFALILFCCSIALFVYGANILSLYEMQNNFDLYHADSLYYVILFSLLFLGCMTYYSVKVMHYHIRVLNSQRTKDKNKLEREVKWR